MLVAATSLHGNHRKYAGDHTISIPSEDDMNAGLIMESREIFTALDIYRCVYKFNWGKVVGLLHPYLVMGNDNINITIAESRWMFGCFPQWTFSSLYTGSISSSAFLTLSRYHSFQHKVRTCGLHEVSVEPVGDERLLELPEEVLEETAHNVELVHLVQHQGAFPADVLLPELLHQPVAPWNAIDPSLQHKTRRDVARGNTVSSLKKNEPHCVNHSRPIVLLQAHPCSYRFLVCNPMHHSGLGHVIKSKHHSGSAHGIREVVFKPVHQSITPRYLTGRF